MNVSSEFVEAFQLFNVINIDKQFELLNITEKYLLCLITIDRHDENDPVALSNFIKISHYFNDILDLHKTGETNIPELRELIKLTKSGKIDTSIIRDSNGNVLEIWERDKIRDFKIDKICKK